jgi:hypothetical protein
VEVYPTLLIKTVSRLSARRGRMASERSVPPGASGACCISYEDGYGTLGVASELGTDSL